MASSSSTTVQSERPCTGATYTITATTSGYGSLSHIDTLPRQLVNMHMTLYPKTPRQDVTALHHGYRNDEVVGWSNESRLLTVTISIRRFAWTTTAKRNLIEQTYALLVRWKGKKAAQTDIIVQLTEIEDWDCVLRNGSWGMWEGAVPDAATRNEGERLGQGFGGTVKDDDYGGRSIAESEKTLVG